MKHTLPLLLALVLALLCSTTHGQDAASRWQAARVGHTYAVEMLGVESESAADTLYAQPYVQAFTNVALSTGSRRSFTILSKAHNDLVVKMLEASVDISEQYPQVGDITQRPFSADLSTTYQPYIPRAHVMAGLDSTCAYKATLCCTWYYSVQTGLSLPLSNVDPDMIFWNGSSTVNGYFTNLFRWYCT